MPWGDAGQPSPNQVDPEGIRQAKLEVAAMIRRQEEKAAMRALYAEGQARLLKRGFTEGDIFPVVVKTHGPPTLIYAKVKIAPDNPGGEAYLRLIQVTGPTTNQEVPTEMEQRVALGQEG